MSVAARGGYVDVLDGIRGLAILLVLFHHVVVYSGIDRSHLLDRIIVVGGHATWFGVDLFFVLSGFLITGILYDAKGSKRYYKNFYARRTLRIFPMYFGFLALFFWLAPALMEPVDAVEMSSRQVYFWTYLVNFDVALHGWPPWLGHFWSLAVEEQFYLIWPIVVLLLSRRTLVLVCAASAAVALCVRVSLPAVTEPIAGYVLLPARMDTLTLGALLALLIRTESGRDWLRANATKMLAAGLAALAVIFVAREGLRELDPVVQTLGYLVIAVTATGLIASVLGAGERNWLSRLFRVRPLMRLGKYSYGLYVLHQPIMQALQETGLTVEAVGRLGGSAIPGLFVFALVSVSLSVVAALLSWHLWEQRFLGLKRYFRDPGLASGTSRVQADHAKWRKLPPDTGRH